MDNKLFTFETKAAAVKFSKRFVNGVIKFAISKVEGRWELRVTEYPAEAQSLTAGELVWLGARGWSLIGEVETANGFTLLKGSGWTVRLRPTAQVVVSC